MSKTRSMYSCSVCGSHQSRWMGRCPSCGSWGTLQETAPPSSSVTEGTAARATPHLLQEVDQEAPGAISTGSKPMDAMFGEGLTPGSVILLGGDPGVGKSTFVLQLAGGFCRREGSAVYVTGEESLAQIRQRAERLEVLGPGIRALNTNRLEDVLAVFQAGEAPDLLLVDSIQTLASSQAEGAAGSVSQVRACASALLEEVKATNTVLVLIGHVTKEGQIAGPKLLEHMVDTVLYMEGDRQQMYRVLRVVKNRFGPIGNLLVLTMARQGLHIVHDPSTFFLQARDPTLSGTAVVMALEGQRAFAIEVQALASRSFLGTPRRTALGFDTNRLHLLLALLEKKLHLDLGGVDLYARIGGGLRLEEPALDLGILAAVLSSFKDRALPKRAVFWGEVDLSGQVRPVSGQDTRLRQARQLGFSPICCPGADTKSASDVVTLDNILGLEEALFS
ncbi:MAG: DNA repair protein RadA [Desulfohalobiaceae bacterium]|nr:DNA repair protein RadA [Desulfohalobiaceae bacterium]